MMAAYHTKWLHKILFVCYFINLMWIYNDVNYYQDSFWNSETGLPQQTHRQRRHFTQIYAMTFKTSIKHLKGESSTNLPSPISKSTKHGYVTLALPKRTFLVDLTVHMDIKANPGPETQENQENRIGNRPCLDLNSRATGTIRYSRNELLNLRPKYHTQQRRSFWTIKP